jgi:hypothetical protein
MNHNRAARLLEISAKCLPAIFGIVDDIGPNGDGVTKKIGPVIARIAVPAELGRIGMERAGGETILTDARQRAAASPVTDAQQIQIIWMRAERSACSPGRSSATHPPCR